MNTLKIYRDKNGKSPFVRWLNKLGDKRVRARIQVRLNYMAVGHYGDYKNLGDGIYELRLHIKSGYRIYFSEYDDTVVLLLIGGNKRSQVRDIKKAKAYWHQLQAENNHE